MDIKIRTEFFFDRDAVTGAVDKKTRRALSTFGRFVRTRSRSSIRPARMKRIAELTDEEKQLWEIKKRVAKRDGWKPRRPIKHSDPGDPPRSITGLLKKLIFYVYEPDSRNVVIGPATSSMNTGAPEILEHGGTTRGSQGGTVRVEARPYMEPAFDEELSNVPRLFAR